MRFKSKKSKGCQVFAVSGTNTVSFGVNADASARKGLLGFAVERIDHTENERYFLKTYKVFPSVIAHPDEKTRVTSREHPIQDLFWSDFTAKAGYSYEYLFYPVRGRPKRLEHGDPVSIKVRTEPLFTDGEHDVFFNRGVASSQAYVQEFGRQPIEKLEPEKKKRALAWLSRDLDEALIKFIKSAKKGDALLGCFYEFRYQPVADELRTAITRGVDVHLVVDGKVNEHHDKKGVFHASFPRVENVKMLKAAKIPVSRYKLRTSRRNAIQHNKFMVLLKGKGRIPKEVWTGSTNLSTGGIHGQTNVGHWLRDGAAAERFKEYWDLMHSDAGSKVGDTAAVAKKKNAELRAAVEALHVEPKSVELIPDGTTPLFSPMAGLTALNLYVDAIDSSESSGCITLAFGINKLFKDELVDNPPSGPLLFLLLEKADKPAKNAKTPFVAVNAKNNVYKAWGSYIQDPVYQWARETNTRALGLNQHVAYVHSKFLLRDPLGADPIVVTGSANFSDSSTNENDENMLIIRGNTRVADIYFTEFNRIFFHYYFRSVVEATKGDVPISDAGVQFLKEDPKEWLANYKPGKLKQKRADMLTGMGGLTR